MSLYHPNDSKDNCGFGLIAQVKGKASHKLVQTAIEGLDRMQHRGGIAADGKTGDGCGLLLQKPDSFFSEIAEENGWKLGKKYGVGMVFLNQDETLAKQYKEKGEKMLIELSENYQSKDVNTACLLHSTGHAPANSEIDYSIIYADYYYVEALMRKANLKE